MVRNDPTAFTPDALRAMVFACFRDMVDAITITSFAAGETITPGLMVSAPKAAPTGPTLAEATEAYIAAKQSTWTAKTLESRRRRLAYLNEHLGDNTAIRVVTADDIRSFRDAVCRFRRQQGRSGQESFAAKQTQNVADRIEPKTAILIFEPIKAFFRWSKSEQGYLATNPAEDIRISVPKRAKGKKTRRPFTASELVRLFSAPFFTGCLSTSRRFDRGDRVIRDAKFWLPILALYSGARLGELVQLHLADIDAEDGIAFLRITDEVSGPPTAETKHVKSEAGIRRIPLHSDLLALGFLKFVEARRRQQRRGSKRLFPEIPYGADGQASTVFSKYFGRLLDKVGLDDPGLVFHSFRHHAEDAFRDALLPQYVIDRIIGHSDGATSAGYGNGISLEVARDAVQAMKLKVRLPAVAGFPRD